VVAIFSGTVNPAGDKTEVTRLLRTGNRQSGLLDWDELTVSQPFFGGRTLASPSELRRRRVVDDYNHTIAAEIKSKSGATDKVHAIFVADSDMISDGMFQLVEGDLLGIRFDNVTFVLNAVDALAGDDAYIELRKRRPELRTLKTVEDEKKTFQESLAAAIKKAEDEAQKRLDEAQKRLDDAVKQIEEDTTLDPRAKSQQIAIVRDREQKLLDAQRREVERDKEQQIEQQRRKTEREVRRIENKVWMYAVLLPPIPAIVLMVVVLSIRLMNETTGVAPERMVKR
jgi:ABC-2 type transport system permease protein